MTMTKTATTPARASYELLDLDPEAITVRNIRAPKPSPRLVASIREHGVLQPIGVLRTEDGELVLRFGDRRRRACIEVGCPVRAVVVDGTAGTDEAELRRIFEQLDENENREDLTVADRAGAVEALFALGADAAVVARRTGLSRQEIAAARRIAVSETARTLAGQYPLDLEQAAAVAEFGEDDDTVTLLVEAAEEGTGEFAHTLQRARDDRAGREAVAARAAELTAEGITVSSGGHGWENRVEYLVGADGERFTSETHKACPGNVVVLHAGYGSKVGEAWYCADPKGNGHRKYRQDSPSGSAEEAAGERKKVLAGNKAWRSAETVRRTWLRDFLARPKVPDGALQFTLEAFACGDNNLQQAMQARSDGRHVMARQLLGLPQGDGSSWSRPPEVYTAMVAASPARAQVIALAIVLGACEAATGVHSWRSPGTDTAGYLEALARWGYGLSDIERELVATARGKAAAQQARFPDHQAAAASEDGHAHTGTEAADKDGQACQYGCDGGVIRYGIDPDTELACPEHGADDA